jgi:hypothetical protein
MLIIVPTSIYCINEQYIGFVGISSINYNIFAKAGKGGDLTIGD